MAVDLVGVFQVGRFIETNVESFNIYIPLSSFIIHYMCTGNTFCRKRTLQYSMRVATVKRSYEKTS